jgi:hypothetical protein
MLHEPSYFEQVRVVWECNRTGAIHKLVCVCVCVCVCFRIAEHGERMIYGRDDDRSKDGSEKLYNFIANVLQSELYRALIVKADAPIQQLSYLINMYVYVCERELVGLQLYVRDLSGVCVCVCVCTPCTNTYVQCRFSGLHAISSDTWPSDIKRDRCSWWHAPRSSTH